MNLSEIIAEMEAHPDTVQVLQEDHTSHVFCRVFYDLGDNIAREQSINIIIKDRGLPSEVAYYETQKPRHMQSIPQFKIDLEAKIAAFKSVQSDFKMHQIISIDNDEERAIIDTWWVEGLNLTKKQYGAWRKADSSIDFMEIV